MEMKLCLTLFVVSPLEVMLPEAKKSEVVAHTKMLGPKESDSITLKFSEPGVYEFICTFPGHFQLGMKGTITVQ